MVPTINTSKMPFKQMENIEHFLAACKSLRLQDGQLFVAIDLYEKANMTQVRDTQSEDVSSSLTFLLGGV